MKILQVSTSADIGGAGIAAQRLNLGLRSLGVDSKMLVNKQRRRNDFVATPASNYDKVLARTAPLLERIPGRLCGRPVGSISPSWAPDTLCRRIDKFSPDILNLHWVNGGFMRIETLPKLRQPIVWTLHDMWPFSGGEHYVGDSVRYKEGYKANNRPANETGLDINRWIWARKKKSWSKIRNLVIAAPSRWMANCARESALFHDLRIEVLPNGIDHERFHPIGQGISREILGLPGSKNIILFGAGLATGDKRKGYHLLVEALKKLELRTDPDDCELVVFGSPSGDCPFSMKTHFLNRLQDEISLAIVYAAADVFVVPSLEDNLPNTVLESLSCGTPVVAFDIGGIPDMVSHKKNGYLAPGFDTTDLANGLLWVMEDKSRLGNLSQEARSTVVQSFTQQQSAARYVDLYEEMLEKI
ncbi:MAG: glycosyltransferase family 4 protein [Nitrosomonadaceae bacterium]